MRVPKLAVCGIVMESTQVYSVSMRRFLMLDPRVDGCCSTCNDQAMHLPARARRLVPNLRRTTEVFEQSVWLM